jgi:cytochrome c553
MGCNRVTSRLIWLVSIIILIAIVWSVVWFLDNDTVDDFLEQHWTYPISPQGKPPQQFSELEASLDPASCGQCHAAQYEQWRGSLHSHTIGPGIRWQLQLADMETAKSCLRCHAPMSEQLALLSQERGWSKIDSAPPDYIPQNLHKQGLVCAACHVRSHTRYGPVASKAVTDRSVHDGFIEHKAFEDSRFCANCHQFPETGSRLNGKLREDTYSQWLATRFAEEEKSCQSCHMPQRQHLWKGVHDAGMTRSALSVQFIGQQAAPGVLNLRAEVTNSGAGHHFPTYLVPEIVLYLEYVDADGRVSELARRVLAWRANLALTEELFDQRLAAGETVVLHGEANNIDDNGSVRLRVSVAPRQHYVRTFESYLKTNQKTLDAETLALVRQAISEAKAVEYEYIAAQQSLGSVAN